MYNVMPSDFFYDFASTAQVLLDQGTYLPSTTLKTSSIAIKWEKKHAAFNNKREHKVTLPTYLFIYLCVKRNEITAPKNNIAEILSTREPARDFKNSKRRQLELPSRSSEFASPPANERAGRLFTLGSATGPACSPTRFDFWLLLLNEKVASPHFFGEALVRAWACL